MNHDMFKFKLDLIKKLNKQVQQASENQNMAKMEKEETLVFWLVLFLLAVYVMWVPR